MSTLEPQRLANFIIGGTEKAGTTSVFTYLSEHPAVCAANVKETDYFRSERDWDSGEALAGYGQYFNRCTGEQPVIMEASPGYLGEAALVAPRISQHLPDAKLLFILREPTARFKSSYRFHQARFNLPEGLSLRSYFDACVQYDAGEASALELGEWYLKVLRFGKYAEGLAHYFANVDAARIKVLYFEELENDPVTFMNEVSAFLEIDCAFWDHYAFHKQNVTFASRFALLHKVALAANTRLEPVLRRNPWIKRMILSAYKALNENSATATDSNEPELEAEMRAYYAQANQELVALVKRQLPQQWLA